MQISLTNAGVKAGVRFENIISGEVDSIAGKAEMAAHRGFWVQLRNCFSLGRGAGSCMRKAHWHEKQALCANFNDLI